MNHTKKILVVGGGISGITATNEIAAIGHYVTLIEQSPFLGGRVMQFSSYFPKLCPPQCGLEINFSNLLKNSRIQIITNATLADYSGQKGQFKVKIIKAPEIINNKCTSCGKCADVCPEQFKSEYDYGLSKLKVAFLPNEFAIPYKYHISEKQCLKKNCQKCIEVCEYGAIDLDATSTLIEDEFYSIIFACGWKPYDARKLELMQYGKHPDILTNVEFERILSLNGPTAGKIIRLSDGNVPENICFVQCAGSRDQNHLDYCSAVCCSASIKQAIMVSNYHHSINSTIFYIDLRLSGRNEELLSVAKEKQNISFIKGKAGKIHIIDNELFIEAEDITCRKKIYQKADMIVLATGMVPQNPFPDTSNINIDFLKNNELTEGIFATGCLVKPMDVSASVKFSTGISLMAIQDREV